MAFSYFKNGITDLIPSNILDFNTIVNMVLNNQDDIIINHIRRLRIEGKEEYKKIKQEQQYFTPHCILRYRKLDGNFFDKNFIDFSGYIFYDLDFKGQLNEVDNYKKYLIKKYGHIASLICKSISGGGVTIGFKIKNKIETLDQFYSAISFITSNILDKEIEYIDTSLYRVGQPLHITSDPMAFVDFNNEIEVDLMFPSIIEKSIKQYIMGNYIDNIPIDTFLKLSLKQILKHVKLETRVSVLNRIVDLKRVEVAKIHYRKKKILDTQKHKAYTAIIHTLVYINPDIHPAYLFAYLNYYNQFMADPPMVYGKLESHFRFVYNSIIDDKENDNYNFSNIKVKWVHTNKLSCVSPENRNIIANKLNGKRRSNPSIEKILETKKQLILDGVKITQKNIAEKSGISITTVKRHYKEEPIDLDEYVKELNSYTEECFIDINMKNEKIEQFDIHPDCPSWVFRQDDFRLR